MGLFSQETIEQEKEFGEIIPFAANIYNCEVIEVKVVQTEDTNWDSGQPVRVPDTLVDQVQVVFDVQSTFDGSPVTSPDGKDPTFTSLSLWFSPVKTGMSKKGPSRARQFITTVMDWKINDPINLAILEDLIVNKKLIGKKLRLNISVTDKNKNKIDGFLAIKK